ncbi:MAG: TldD/PmbA family protein [Candidatus Heimdallarchaeaceae archaeon]
MNTNDIQSDEFYYLASSTLEFALKQDISEAEIYYTDIHTLQVVCSGTSISNERETNELGFAVRVLKGSSEGFSYTNKLDKESLEKCALEAVKMAKVNPPKEGVSLVPPSGYTEIKNLYSEKLTTFTIEEMIKNATEILKPFDEAPVSVRTELSRLVLSEEKIGLINSLGLEGYYKRNNLSGGFIAIAREGEKVGGFVTDSFFTRDPDEVDYYSFGKKLADRAVRNLNAEQATKIDSDIVIFKPEAVFNPIFIVMGLTVAADNVQRNRSFWKDKIADTVAIEGFNLVDDSYTLNSGGARVFDDEGTPTQRTSIIKDGMLESFIFDQTTANRASTQSTGHSYRGQGGIRFMNPPNFIFPNAPLIKPGSFHLDELIEDTKLAIIFEYFSGSSRPENGMFSGVAKGAQLIKDGAIEKPLTNVSISGNVFNLLLNIEGMSKEVKLVNGFLSTPTIKAKGINISTQK